MDILIMGYCLGASKFSFHSLVWAAGTPPTAVGPGWGPHQPAENEISEYFKYRLVTLFSSLIMTYFLVFPLIN